MFVSRALEGPALAPLLERHDVQMWPDDEPPTPAQLRRETAPCEGLLCTLSDRVDEQLLDACPRLRAISNLAVGYDNVDVAAAAARGISVGHTPGVLTDAVADLTFGLLIAAARRVLDGERAVRSGEWGAWKPNWMIGADVSGTTLGIVGYGAIGQAVARRAAGFDMRVVWTSSSGGLPLYELLAQADHVSLHCPLTPATRGLIDARALRTMKRSATLVNTARGAVVDSAALRVALRDGEIAGAALDVADPEPLAPDDPLLDAPNLIVTPHIGSASVLTRRRMAELAVANLLAGLAGEALPHAVPTGAPA